MIRYKEHYIYECGINSSGMRYYAYTDSGRVMADTLAGIKQIIGALGHDGGY